MNAVLPVTPTSSSAARVDLGGLVQAVSQSVAEDGLLNPFTPEQW
ncbi:cyclic nucleotide-binding domain-containing protein, partial [Corallococcus coralloides]|nr:cyclic nucleotide-binding domain-containing protein [Corallococcus coralloides]